MQNEAPLPLSAATIAERTFVQRVYAWMAGGLGVTALVSLFMLLNPVMIDGLVRTPVLFYGLIFAELGLVFYLSARVHALEAGTAGLLFLVYSALNGMTLTPLLAVYTGASVFGAFAVTCGTFGVMSVYGYFTKKDLTSWGNVLFMGLIGIIIASVVNIFLASSVLDAAISYIGVLVFTGLVAYDTQKIKQMQAAGAAGNLAILGALSLYLDFINLFIMLLRILGSRRD